MKLEVTTKICILSEILPLSISLALPRNRAMYVSKIDKQNINMIPYYFQGNQLGSSIPLPLNMIRQFAGGVVDDDGMPPAEASNKK